MYGIAPTPCLEPERAANPFCGLIRGAWKAASRWGQTSFVDTGTGGRKGNRIGFLGFRKYSYGLVSSGLCGYRGDNRTGGQNNPRSSRTHHAGPEGANWYSKSRDRIQTGGVSGKGFSASR
jgi:hypothetical protein